MFRTTLLRSSRQILQSSTRSLSSSSRAAQKPLPKWVLPSTIVSIGLASIYLAQPLSLDSQPKKPKAPEAKAAENPASEPTAAEPKPEVETQPGAEGEDGEPQQQAAYNPETGEINWDCPCLGGMAHGPCGEEFKEAFSCFVFSEAEPKGFDCIEKFKNMQNCFRKYPEIYSEEIRDDEAHEHIEAAPSEDASPFDADSPAEAVTAAPAKVEEVVVVEEVVEVPAIGIEIPRADITHPVTEELTK